MAAPGPGGGSSGGASGGAPGPPPELHPRCGRLVSLSQGGRSAARAQPGQEFNHGLVLSREPLRPGRVFTVRIDRKVNSWSGSIEVGVTALDPAELEFPSSATGLRGGSWVLSGRSVLRDGRSLREDFGPDLDALAEGDRVGVEATARGELRLWVNGRDCGVAAAGLPPRLWAVVDLYGKCTQVTVVAPEGDGEGGAEERGVGGTERGVGGNERGMAAMEQRGMAAMEQRGMAAMEQRGMAANERAMAAMERGVVAMDQRGMVGNERGMTSNERGMAAMEQRGMAAMERGMAAMEQRGMTSNERGMTANERGMTSNERGMTAMERGVAATEQRGMGGNERGMMSNERGMAAMERGMAAMERGMAAMEQRGTVAMERGMAANERGMVTNERAMAANERGMMSNERGMVAMEQRGMTSNERAMAANERGGMVANERGMVANERGMVAMEHRGVVAMERGMAANERGMVANERGMVAMERGMAATEQRGMAANERGMVASERGMAAMEHRGTAATEQRGGSARQAELAEVGGETQPVPARAPPQPRPDKFPDSLEPPAPAVTNESLLFHEKCGALIKLSNGHKTAERRRPLDEFNNGVVLTNRPLRDGEMFEIRIDKLVDKWSGSIEIGVTAHNPNSLEYPATMTNLRSGTIMMSGCGILTNGKGTRREYCEFSLDELQEGDHIGLTRKANNALHFYINGVDQGVATSLTPQVVYGVVDLYGMAVKVTIVHNHNHSDRLRRNNAILRALSPEGTAGTPRRATATAAAATGAATAPPPRLLFHPNCGQKAAVVNEGRTALRPHATDDFNHGVVLSARPLGDNELFQVRLDKMVDKWAGSIEIGVTTHNPAYLQLPSTMTNLRSGTWMMTGNGVMHNGTTVLDEYGHNLDRLKAGDTVGVVRRDDGTLHFFVNGVAQGPAAWNVPPNVYAVVDLYGQAAQATIVDEGEVPALLGDGSEGDSGGGSPEGASPGASPSDLRFHRLHGANAVITNGGRTALRQNCRSEFNDAIVISNRALRDGELFEIVIQKMVDRWSGSIEAGVTAIRPEDLEFPNTMTDIDYDTWMLSGTAIMQDGNTMRNNYGCDLDALGTGARIGMMRTGGGDLRYFIDGTDQGVACSGLPPEVYAVVDLYGQCVQVSLTGASGPADNSQSPGAGPDKAPPPSPAPGPCQRFHGRCGQNVALAAEGLGAARVSGYCHGLVFSRSHLRPGELFEVRIEALDERWAGSLRVGLTALPPPGPPALPPSLLDLPAPPTWAVTGAEVRHNGAQVRHNYGVSLDRLTVGNRLGVRRGPDDSLHLVVDGQDMGPAATGVAKNAFVALDLYGRVTAVSIVSAGGGAGAGGGDGPSPTPSPSPSPSPSEPQPLPPPGGDGGDWGPPTFLSHGKNILLSNGARTATRVSSYNQGLVLVGQPLPPGRLFQVQIDALNPQWSSSLALGVTGAPPGRSPLPACAHGLKRPAWILQRRAVFHNARKIRDLPGPSLELLPAGSVLGLLVDGGGRLHLFINGRDQGAVAGGVPSPCYVLLDLYGQCQQVTIVAEGPAGGGSPSGDPRNRGDVEKADVVDGVKESLCWGPPAPPQPCPYQALCARFKDLLLLPDEYFAPEPRRSRCFCQGCERGGGDPRDPREPPLPLGWCRFSLRPKPRPEGGGGWQKWPRAYHGTSAGAVRRSLDRGELVPGPWSLLCAPCRPDPSGPAHSRSGSAPPGSGPRPPGPAPLVLSPALGYAAMETFASRVTFREPGWPRPRGAQVAFEVWVRPGSFRAGPPSLSPPPALEPPQGLDPAQLEWVTKEPGATVLAGLLVRVD